VKPRTLLIILILVLLAYLGWKYLWPKDDGGDREAQRDNAALILDRVWVDSNPQKYTDYVQAMLMLSDIPMGVFQKASAYRVELELFEFTRKGHKVGLHFPQDERSGDFKFKIRSCDELPPFDLCLDLTRNPWKGPKRYYGLTDGHAEQELLGDLRARLIGSAAR
jgi:hypothetical protein